MAAMDPSGSLSNITNDIRSGGGYCVRDRFDYLQNRIVIDCINNIVTEFMMYPGAAIQGTLPRAAAFAGLPQLREFGCQNCTNLKGKFPQDWGLTTTLLNLRKINITAANSITGMLPAEWGNLVNLQNLTLASIANASLFTGGIPERWGNMNSLQFVDIARLQLSNTSCVPSTWLTVNGLVPNVTLLYPPGLGKDNIYAPFCNVTTALD
jgi:hypothetical protein